MLKIKDYQKLFNYLWVIIWVIYFVRNLELLPFWATILFSLAIIYPFYLVTNLLINKLQPKALTKKRMGLFMIQFILLTFLISIISVLISYLFYYLSEIDIFPKSSLFYESGPIFSEIFNKLPIIILLNLIFSGLRLYFEHSKLQQIHLETQVKMLQYQISPHFMFNVLNHIHILIRKDPKLATELLERYSETLRYQLYQTKKDKVTLKDEINFLENVVNIEVFRWKDSLNITFEYSIEDELKSIPPLIFSAFIENAFKYVSKSTIDRGFVLIEINQRKDELYFSIKNSTDSKSQFMKNKNASGIGLANTKDRLDLTYPNKYELKISETNEEYNVELKINLI